MRGALIQRWHLVGLQPMHDALVRRLAMEECRSFGTESKLELSIAWSTGERFTSWNGWARAEEVDVLIAARDRVTEILEGLEGTNQSFFADTGNQTWLRLLWSGLEGDRHDLVWASQWLAHGAIVDLASLSSWIRIAVRLASKVPKPSHPFLRDSKLPSL